MTANNRWFVLAVTALVVTAWLGYQAVYVVVRSHNLDVFYKSMTCGDLPLGSGTNEQACEQAIGEFVLPENGLFTR